MAGNELLPPGGSGNLEPPQGPINSRWTERQSQGVLIAVALFSSNLFGLFLGGVWEFLSLRGVVNVLASRIVLAIVWLLGCLLTALVVWSLGVRAKKRTALTGLLVLGLLLYGLDRWVGPPKDLLKAVDSTAYRNLVAQIVRAADPKATVVVGQPVSSPDGVRTVDIQIVSESMRSVIDIVDLPMNRTAGVEFIDAADSKRSDIGADVMLVCSNTGFDEVAISKAKRKKIGLITILHQGDKSLKSVIEEEIYLRRIQLAPITIGYIGEMLPANEPLRSIDYKGGSVFAWLQQKAAAIALLNPFLSEAVTARFNFRMPTLLDVNSRQLRIDAVTVSFQPKVQWLSQVVRFDATAGIYDYLHHTVKLTGPGSFLIEGINFDTGIPMAGAPPVSDLGVGPHPESGEQRISLAMVYGTDISKDTKIAAMDSLVRPEDLSLIVPSSHEHAVSEAH